jgi:predicted RecB family nuclease
MTQVDLARPWPDLDLLLSDLERIRDGTLQTEGLRHRGCDRCPWFSHCRSVWRETSQLSLLPGVEATWIPRLRNMGVPTWTKAAQTDPDRLARSGGLGREEATVLWLHARAWTRRRPVLRRTAHFPADRPIYFVDPGVLEETCTVLACLRFHRGAVEHREFVARQATPGHERAIWDAFLAAVAKDERAAAFPWSRAEQRILAGLWHRYSGDPQAWKAFQTSPSTLQGFVREHFALPVTAYDLGETARLFGERSMARESAPANASGDYQAWTTSRRPEELSRLVQSHRMRLSAMRSIYFGLQMFQETGIAAPA